MRFGKLFIGCGCLGATCRSPQIKGWIQHECDRLKIPAKVISFGVMPSLLLPVSERPIHQRAAQQNSIDIMNEFGIDIRAHIPVHMRNLGPPKDMDFVFSADPDAFAQHVPYFGAAKVMLLDAPDGIYNPYDDTLADKTKQDMNRYRITATQIQALMPEIMEGYVIPLAKANNLFR